VATAAVVIYLVAFITGAIVMSFEMLGSRYLNPIRQRHLYLGRLDLDGARRADRGLFPRRLACDRTASATVLGAPCSSPRSICWHCRLRRSRARIRLADVDDVRSGSLIAAFAIIVLSGLTLFGIYSRSRSGWMLPSRNARAWCPGPSTRLAAGSSSARSAPPSC